MEDDQVQVVVYANCTHCGVINEIASPRLGDVHGLRITSYKWQGISAADRAQTVCRVCKKEFTVDFRF